MFLSLVNRIEKILRCLTELLQEVKIFCPLRAAALWQYERRFKLFRYIVHLHFYSIIVRLKLCRLFPRRIGNIDEAHAVHARIEDNEDTGEHKFAQKFFFAEMHTAHAVKRRNNLVVQVTDHAA